MSRIGSYICRVAWPAIRVAGDYLNRKVPFCNQPWNTMYIQWNGEMVMPCCYGPHDLGDINCQSIAEIWNGKPYRTLRKQICEGKAQGSCIPCYQKERFYADHITPFLSYVLKRKKGNNFRKTCMNCFRHNECIDNSPYVLYLDLSSICNLRCRKCYVYSQEGPLHLGHMSMDIFEKIAPLLKDVLFVVCTGIGESMLNPSFIDILSLIKENECILSFNTNGLLLDEKKALRMVELGVDEIVFSIDSIDPDLYGYHHRGGKFDTLIRNIKRLDSIKKAFPSKKPRLAWYFVAMKSNIGELSKIVAKATHLGFSAIQVAPLLSTKQGQRQEYIDFYDQENLEKPADKDRFLNELRAAAQVAMHSGIDLKSYCLL